MTAVELPKSPPNGARPAGRAARPQNGQNGQTGGSQGPVDTYEQLRQEVLAEIQRRSGSADDPVAVETLARAVVDGYQAKARSGFGGRALANPGDVVARLCRSVLDWGPLTPHFTGQVVFEEMFFHGADISWLDGEGRLVSLDEPISAAEVRSIVDRLLATAGAAVDESRPMIQVQVLDGRARLGVVIPPIADALDATLRWYMIRRETMDLLVRWGSLSPEAASLLVACMGTPTGVLLVGPPGSGKTSLGNAMLKAVPAATRVVCCEDTPELQTDHLNASRWRTRPTTPDGTGEVALRDLVRQALGMRPDLIVVGEVRGAEAYELTRAANAGCGLLTTVHANSAKQGLQALVSTAIMAGQNVPADQVRDVFASTVDLVVHMAREPVEHKRPGGGPIRRQVMEIVALPPHAASKVDFAVEPIFSREEFGAPLRWTQNPLPDDLRGRLDRALRPRGVSVQAILEGRESLL
ncbi:MAG: ATPase, T2SS/T4P/T4SS family [Actinomycetota bacterium]